jgi:DNA-binding transcriptional regulator YhcF (GntR family)
MYSRSQNLRPRTDIRPKATHALLMSRVREGIAAGRYRPGDRLPTHADLLREFSTTPVTVNRALGRLAAEGDVVARAKVGTYVAPHPPCLSTYGLIFDSRRNTKHAPWWSRYNAAIVRAAELEQASRPPVRFRIYEEIDGLTTRESYRELLDDLAMRRLTGAALFFNAWALKSTPVISGDHGVPIVSSSRGVQVPVLQLQMDMFVTRVLDEIADSGRTRVGLLTIPSRQPDYLLSPEFGLAERGLRTSIHWANAADPHQPQWMLHALRGFLDRPAADRPEALIVSDDHLVEPAAEALESLGVRVPDDLLVIGHWNFPLVYDGPIPVRLIGYDARDLLRRLIENIERMRRGEDAEPFAQINPISEEEHEERWQREGAAGVAAALT